MYMLGLQRRAAPAGRAGACLWPPARAGRPAAPLGRPPAASPAGRAGAPLWAPAAATPAGHAGALLWPLLPEASPSPAASAFAKLRSAQVRVYDDRA